MSGALELLIDDHDRVRALFELVEQAENAQELRLIFARAKQELELHAFIEETHFYPMLQSVPELAERVEEAVDEHAEAKELIAALDQLADDVEFEALFKELIEAVQHHLVEEEGALFPKVVKRISPQDLEALGATLFEAREERVQEQKAA